MIFPTPQRDLGRRSSQAHEPFADEMAPALGSLRLESPEGAWGKSFPPHPSRLTGKAGNHLLRHETEPPLFVKATAPLSPPPGSRDAQERRSTRASSRPGEGAPRLHTLICRGRQTLIEETSAAPPPTARPTSSPSPRPSSRPGRLCRGPRHPRRPRPAHHRPPGAPRPAIRRPQARDRHHRQPALHAGRIGAHLRRQLRQLGHEPGLGPLRPDPPLRGRTRRAHALFDGQLPPPLRI
jgi:hypothetical protein